MMEASLGPNSNSAARRRRRSRSSPAIRTACSSSRTMAMVIICQWYCAQGSTEVGTVSETAEDDGAMLAISARALPALDGIANPSCCAGNGSREWKRLGLRIGDLGVQFHSETVAGLLGSDTWITRYLSGAVVLALRDMAWSAFGAS